MGDIDEIRRLAGEATAGPWVVAESLAKHGLDLVRTAEGRFVADATAGAANARYIAALSPDVVLALVERCERMEKALTELLEYADTSDGSCYGTLSTTFVRDVAGAALRNKSEAG